MPLLTRRRAHLEFPRLDARKLQLDVISQVQICRPGQGCSLAVPPSNLLSGDGLEEQYTLHHGARYVRAVIALNFYNLDIQTSPLPPRGCVQAHQAHKIGGSRRMVQTRRALETAGVSHRRSELDLPRVAVVEWHALGAGGEVRSVASAIERGRRAEAIGSQRS